MNERQWHQALASLILLGTLATVGMAQDGAAPAAAANINSPVSASSKWSRMKGNRPYGFLATLDQSLKLSPEQRDAVRGLLASQRQAAQELRQETDNKIRALLNSDQQKRFDALLAEQQSRRAARFQRS